MLKAVKEKLRSRMGKDVVWTFAIQLTIMVCSFVINKLLANRLSIDDFGQYNVIKRSVQVLSFVMLAGVGIALPRYIPLYRNSTPPRTIAPLLSASMIYIIGVSLVVFLIGLLFSDQIQPLIIGGATDESGGMLLLALLYAFALAMAQVVYAYFRGMGDFKWYNGTQLSIQLVIILPLVFLPVLTVYGVFQSWLAITALLVALFMIIKWKEESGKWKLPHAPHSSIHTPHFRESFREIVTYSSGRLVADFFQFSLAAFPLVYISNVCGLESTAWFSVGITFVTMITPLYSFMGIILLPYVSKAIARHEMAAANRLIHRLLLLYMASALFFIAILCLFTEFLTTLLFASDYVVATQLTRIMVLAILPQAVYMLYRNTIDAVSVIPYNAIILGICIVAMVAGFMLSSTLTQFAWAYLAVSNLQGILSLITWQAVKKKA